MKKIFVLLVGSLLWSQTLLAQCFDWNGFYVGVNAGYAWGDAHVRTTLPEVSEDFYSPEIRAQIERMGNRHLHPCGFTGGAQVGYNFQACCSPFVFGLETDIGAFFLEKKHEVTEVDCVCGATITLGHKFQTHWLYTLRGRVGYSCGCWFPFLTGGLAVTHLHHRQNFVDRIVTPFAEERARGSRTVAGWTVGAGLEYGFSRCVSACVTYLYTRFNDVKSSSGWDVFPTPESNNIFNNRARLSANLIRFGLNFRL